MIEPHFPNLTSVHLRHVGPLHDREPLLTTRVRVASRWAEPEASSRGRWRRKAGASARFFWRYSLFAAALVRDDSLLLVANRGAGRDCVFCSRGVMR